MRLSPVITTITALLLAATLLLVGWLFLRPSGPLLPEATFSHETLTPNADGLDDIARIRYTLARPATVSIYFEDADGTRFMYREGNPRESGDYELLFSGIVQGFVLPDESVEGDVIARVLPDGDYTWFVDAESAEEDQVLSGQFTVADADTLLPDLKGFSVSPEIFSPNRDGIDDRTWINVHLDKEAQLSVNLIEYDTGVTRPIGEREGNIPPGMPGLHTFEYEGDVDLGVSPPSDGTHDIVALAEDALGQKVEYRGELNIENGGVPRADIVNATVEFSEQTVIQGDILYFELVVENYGAAPIRTTGPEPGFVYVDDETANTHGHYDESGAWRVGIDCDTCIRDYPWRWSVGEESELTKIGEYYYLMPGQRATVTGGIQLTQIPSRNPLNFWAGLIHEDVEVAQINNRVDPSFTRIVPADEENSLDGEN